MENQQSWWKEAIAYQIYPKSFFDSNGDGIGDIPGITAKLDYLNNLGVNLLWLNPIYRSPDDDNGYDISDYQAINPQYGTMMDFERLLHEAHRRNMKIIMDLVINHTSDEHPWFIESRKSQDNPYRDYYIWRDGKEGGGAPNNWGSHFSQPAWTFDERTNQYYLHIFSRKQPDLNWENPNVRAEIQRMIAWWLDKGIDGFRLDAINLISKTPGLPDNREEGKLIFQTHAQTGLPDTHGEGSYIFSIEHIKNGPAFHDYLRELRRNVFSRYDIVTVAECGLATIDDAIAVTAPERAELDMTFLFEHTEYYNLVERDPQQLKVILTNWQVGLHGRGWTGIAFNNHDQPRVVSCFGNDTTYRIPSAKLFATLLLTLEGTPFLYQGEEIGMTNTYYDHIAEYNDIATLNFYNEQVAAGVDPCVTFEKAKHASRDRSRSPFQWNAETHAGFTTGTPWLKPNRNYNTINLEHDRQQPDSIFSYYQRMIAIRKHAPALVHGEFIPLESPDEVFAYERIYHDESYHVVLNLSEHPIHYSCKGEVIIGNYEEPDSATLQPYEARLYKKQ